MVFMSSSVLTWKPIMMAWMKTQFKTDVATLTHFFEKIFDDTKDFVASKTTPKIKLLECNFIKQVRLMTGRQCYCGVVSDTYCG